MGSYQLKFRGFPLFCFRAIATVVLIVCSFLNFPGHAKANTNNQPLQLGILNNNQVFSSIQSAQQGGKFTLAIKGGSESRIQVSLVDIFADENGMKRILPLGSNPYTAKDLVVFPSQLPTYNQSDEVLKYEIPFRLVNLQEVDRPVLGGLKFSLVRLSGTENQSIVSPSIVATFAYLPEGEIARDYNPLLATTALKISPAREDSFPWSLIPNIPRLFSSSNLIVTLTVKNLGDVFLNSQTTLTLTPMNILGNPAGIPQNIESSPSLLLLPEQVREERFLIDQDTEESEIVDQSSRYGLFALDASTYGQIESEVFATTTQRTYLLIAPWKQLGFFFLLLLYLRKRIAGNLKTLLNGLASLTSSRSVRSAGSALLSSSNSSEGLKFQSEKSQPVQEFPLKSKSIEASRGRELMNLDGALHDSSRLASKSNENPKRKQAPSSKTSANQKVLQSGASTLGRTSTTKKGSKKQVKAPVKRRSSPGRVTKKSS